MAGGLYLLKAWAVSGCPVTSVFSHLLTASGAITVLSGVCTIVLAAYAPENTAFVENVSDARWVTGKIGFTIAGLALLLAAKYQWRGRRHLEESVPRISDCRHRHAVHLG